MQIGHRLPVRVGIALALVTSGRAFAQNVNYVAKFFPYGTPCNSQLFDNGTSVGIGTTSPSTKLTIRTSSTNDGIRILQGGSTASSLGLFNLGAGGHDWALFSLGAGNTQGAGNFCIYDYTAGKERLFLTRTGEMGVDTRSPAAKLHVDDTGYVGATNGARLGGLFQLSSYSTPTLEALRGEVVNLVGLTTNASVGVRGTATTPVIGSNGSSSNTGVFGAATGGHVNEGGHFEAQSSVFGSTNTGIAVTATGAGAGSVYGGSFLAQGGPSTYGVYAYGTGWAGYFAGNLYCTQLFQGSDAKLKRDVRTVEGALAKIAALRPAAYRFRVDEYPELGLPEGEQFGFVAQELQRVFPELVRESVSQALPSEPGAPPREGTRFESVNYTGLVPILVRAVQEQQCVVEEQGARIDALEARLEELASAVERKR